MIDDLLTFAAHVAVACLLLVLAAVAVDLLFRLFTDETDEEGL